MEILIPFGVESVYKVILDWEAIRIKFIENEGLQRGASIPASLYALSSTSAKDRLSGLDSCDDLARVIQIPLMDHVSGS